MHRAQAENIFRLLNLHYLHPARLWYLVASAGILPCRSTGRARLEGKPAEPRGNDTGLTRWCQVTETFSSSGNSGRMFSTNSFHDLVIPISLNWNGSQELSCPSSHIFVLLSLQPLFCSHSKMSHCFTVITLRSFFSLLAVPDLQFRALVILCSFCLAILSPRPSTSPAATPFSAYVCLILGGVVCLGLGVWGVMLRDFQLMGWRGREGERGRASGGYRIGGEKRRGRVDGRAKCFGPESIGADYLPRKTTPKVE